MGAEKHGSKSGGGYVGGLLHLFDWNAKSRKKLFSSKPSIPELSKQKKRCDGNLPRTRFHLIDEDEFVTGSSIKGSSDYSCASSVTDEDIGGVRAPGVVARLMGLDAMPTCNLAEPYATPYLYSQSLKDSNYHSKNLGGHCEYQSILSGNLQNNMVASVGNSLEPKRPKPLSRPIEKFQTEVLPPKSAKSIPITHHKLLSPIKSANFIPSESAAHIMEAAARIIGPGPQATTTNVKMPVVGSSSVPLKVRDLKEKVESSQKPSKSSEVSRHPIEANAFKHLKGQSLNKSWNGSADTTSSKISSNSEECSSTAKSKGKSISLALQAKANVQKREGLNSNTSRILSGQKESPEVISSEFFKNRASSQKSTQKKPSTLADSNVLRQNNQKQNCSVDRGKQMSKPSTTNVQGGKPHNGNSSSARYKSASKNASNSKVVSRRLNTEGMNSKREDSSSTTRNITCKKRSIDGNFQFEKNRTLDNNVIGKNGKLIESSTLADKQNSLTEACKRKGTDVISFTFTAPMTRSFVHGPEAFREVSEKNSDALSADCRGKRSSQTSDNMHKKFSLFGPNIIGGDALSTLLEQKLRELTHAVETSRIKAGTGWTSPSIFQDSMPDLDALSSSTSLLDDRSRDAINRDHIVDKCNSGFSTDLQGFIMKHKSQVTDQAMDNNSRNNFDARQFLHHRLPSPVSVLGHSIFTESCNSSDTADSINTGGSKESSSVNAQEVLGISCFKNPHLVDSETELSDSASSMSTVSISEKQAVSSSMTELNHSAKWELDYVKEMLSNIELMFKDFALGRAGQIINPGLFDQLESQKTVLCKDEPKISRQVLFDSVAECLDIRFRRYVGGGYKTWVNGLSLVRSKGKLAEEAYKEISGWNDMGDCMVDELVGKDMSSKHGRWLDFEIEAFELGVQIGNRILNLLLDEVIADILVP
ncbi:uncharacterized protein [Coffea arabica]|uniref:Uncharacterized protein LOC113736849 n=1 Tax=Coffea arabica TaxID=13443 RepID=A0A6P6WWQ1_COFAR|nr:uncharacterized protein LOC113736849 [Coffea arabica]XP_027119823.1 uncharacterized protein LOC113736849 [Coffea arabica]XP_027119824.1 uncharacterized protein LOC113736849 [Coffea arabica]XP_027119825.1 uncharacterized protein LOC113736849 [Coffea arabica]